MNLDKIKTLVILGDTDSGKTNLAFYHMNNYKGKRQKYLVGYPKKIKGYNSLSNFNDIFRLKDSIIYIDEISKYVRVYDKKANYELMEMISLFKHKNNTLIFSTQLSQFITKGIEAFIEVWNLTKIMDLGNFKNGSKPKRIIQNTKIPQCTSWSLALEIGEYLEFSEYNDIGENGVHNFPDQKIGKDWR